MKISEPWGKGTMHVSLKAEDAIVSYSTHVEPLSISMLDVIYLKMLHPRELRDALIHGY